LGRRPPAIAHGEGRKVEARQVGHLELVDAGGVRGAGKRTRRRQALYRVVNVRRAA